MTDPILDEAARMMAAADTALERLVADARRAAERSDPTRVWALAAVTKTDAPTAHVLAAAAVRLAEMEEDRRG